MTLRSQILLFICSLVLSFLVVKQYLKRFEMISEMSPRQVSNLPEWYFVAGENPETGAYRLYALESRSKEFVSARLHKRLDESYREFTENWPNAEIKGDESDSQISFSLPTDPNRLADVEKQLESSARSQWMSWNIDITVQDQEDDKSQLVELAMSEDAGSTTFVYEATRDGVIPLRTITRSPGMAHVGGFLGIIGAFVLYVSVSLLVRTSIRIRNRHQTVP